MDIAITTPGSKCLLIALAMVVPICSLGQYIPPDFYEELYKESIGFYPNEGQVIDTDDQLRPDIEFISEGVSPKLYMRSNGSISFVIGEPVPDSIGPDLLHRIDMRLARREPIISNPQGYVIKGVHHNYYYPHTAPNGIELVHGFNRLIYEDVYPFIDLHLYSGSSGERMSFVCRPGSDPEHIYLLFEGQDSLKVDVQGELKLHLHGKYLSFREAVAYQVDAQQNVLPLQWGAEYEDLNGQGLLSFYYDQYDPTLPLVLQIGAPPASAGGGTSPANLSWSTTLGADSPNPIGLGNFACAMDADLSGNVYVAGTTQYVDFPVNPGTTPFIQGWDTYVAKFAYAVGVPADDAQNNWTSFYGGDGNDKPQVLLYQNVLDKVFVGGWTNSSNVNVIPNQNPGDGSFYQSVLQGANDGLLLRIDPFFGLIDRAGYIGGPGSESITAITQGDGGNVYLGGITDTQAGVYNGCNASVGGFPLCDPGGNAYQQASSAGGVDGFVVRLNDAFEMTWSTFYGGSADDKIYDAAHDGSGISPGRVVYVGQTFGNTPQGTQGAFQLGFSGGPENGFLVSFTSLGELDWSTNLPGLQSIQAATVEQSTGHLVVQGITKVNNGIPVLNYGCVPVPGELSICDPGGGAYIDGTLGYIDQYFAEFDLYTGNLLWSTLFGGTTDESAEIVFGTYTNYQLFDVYRVEDLEMDNDGNLYAMGIAAQGVASAPESFATVPAWGFYDKPFDQGMGNNQSEVTLCCFAADRSLFWSSMFGSGFAHIGSHDDFKFLNLGSDFGHDIALVPGVALYAAGVTGGYNYDLECPYPFPTGNSYCEDPLAGGLNFGLDPYQGFVARFDLVGLAVNTDDLAPLAPVSAGSVLFNEATSMLSIHCSDERVKRQLVRVFDATGRLVTSGTVGGSGSLSMASLSSGAYVVHAQPFGAGTPWAARFVKSTPR